MTEKAAKVQTVDEYVAGLPEEVRPVVQEIRKTILAAAPGAKEVISYGMPAYKLKRVLVYFAAWKNHIGFYALPSGVEAFKSRVEKYATSKGTIQFPLEEEMPLALIAEMVAFRVQEELQRGK
ncbi:MAG: hypothetical protein GC181_12145 [Bacteroidetes bacterium]|nr:hypothetical protein [Bacteroidota bacterium]